MIMKLAEALLSIQRYIMVFICEWLEILTECGIMTIRSQRLCNIAISYLYEIRYNLLSNID